MFDIIYEFPKRSDVFAGENFSILLHMLEEANFIVTSHFTLLIYSLTSTSGSQN